MQVVCMGADAAGSAALSPLVLSLLLQPVAAAAAMCSGACCWCLLLIAAADCCCAGAAAAAAAAAVGECQGPEQQLQEMKQWLCTEGSPYSHIEDCKFSSERQLQQLEFEVFERRKNVP
jgi:hypothetical protein